MDECQHTKTHLTVVPDKNKNLRFRYQCLECHQPTTNYIKRDEVIRQGFAIELLPLFDNAARDKYWEDQDDMRARERALEDTQKQAEWAQKRVDYQLYLRSPEWREKRELVMKRAGRMCEGCARKPAAQVHHLTYAHIRNELLFELVALCDGCHAVAHGQIHADLYAE